MTCRFFRCMLLGPILIFLGFFIFALLNDWANTFQSTMDLSLQNIWNWEPLDVVLSEGNRQLPGKIVLADFWKNSSRKEIQTEFESLDRLPQEPKVSNINPAHNRHMELQMQAVEMPITGAGITPAHALFKLSIARHTASLSGRQMTKHAPTKKPNVNTAIGKNLTSNITSTVRFASAQHTPTTYTKNIFRSQSVTIRSKIISSKVPLARLLYEPGFTYSNANICLDKGKGIRILILITSAPQNFLSRTAIRFTWGHFGERSDISIGFLLGNTDNASLQQKLTNEMALYNDIIMTNSIDSYENLTLKTLSMLEWAETYCAHAQFTLKADDDMFINVPNLLGFIDNLGINVSTSAGEFFGRLAERWKPIRNKTSKYFLSLEQFGKSVLPSFVSGPAYLFRTQFASKVLKKALETSFLRLEDVFLTGIVADLLGMQRVAVDGFKNTRLNPNQKHVCIFHRCISIHGVSFEDQFQFWGKLLDGTSQCA